MRLCFHPEGTMASPVLIHGYNCSRGWLISRIASSPSLRTHPLQVPWILSEAMASKTFVSAKPDVRFTFGAVLGGSYIATAQVLSEYFFTTAYLPFFQFIWGLMHSGDSLCSELPQGSGAFEGLGTSGFMHACPPPLTLRRRSL